MSNDSLFNRSPRSNPASSLDLYFLQNELESALYWAGYINFKRSGVRGVFQEKPMPWEYETEREYL